MVKAIYNSENMGKHTVYGTARILGGRPVFYGRRKGGDVFNVAVDDIKAYPARWLAPCGKPFDFNALGGIIIPCQDEEPEAPEEVHGDNLEEIPGVGPASAIKLVEAGFIMKSQVLDMNEEQLIDVGLAPQSRRKIREWQQSKR